MVWSDWVPLEGVAMVTVMNQMFLDHLIKASVLEMGNENPVVGEIGETVCKKKSDAKVDRHNSKIA